MARLLKRTVFSYYLVYHTFILFQIFRKHFLAFSQTFSPPKKEEIAITKTETFVKYLKQLVITLKLLENTPLIQRKANNLKPQNFKWLQRCLNVIFLKQTVDTRRHHQILAFSLTQPIVISTRTTAKYTLIFSYPTLTVLSWSPTSGNFTIIQNDWDLLKNKSWHSS